MKCAMACTRCAAALSVRSTAFPVCWVSSSLRCIVGYLLSSVQPTKWSLRSLPHFAFESWCTGSSGLGACAKVSAGATADKKCPIGRLGCAASTSTSKYKYKRKHKHKYKDKDKDWKVHTSTLALHPLPEPLSSSRYMHRCNTQAWVNTNDACTWTTLISIRHKR